jgi:hypothetical protein
MREKILWFEFCLKLTGYHVQAPAGHSLMFYALSAVILTRALATAGATYPISGVLQKAKDPASHDQFQWAATLLESVRAGAARAHDGFFEAVILNSPGLAFEKQAKYFRVEGRIQPVNFPAY